MAIAGQYGRRRRRGRQNRLGMFLVTVVVLMLMIAVTMNSRSLKAKKAAYDEQIAILNEQIRAEEERAKELEEFAKYAKTKAYYEEIARQRLGLVYPDEIIFKQEEGQSKELAFRLLFFTYHAVDTAYNSLR